MESKLVEHTLDAIRHHDAHYHAHNKLDLTGKSVEAWKPMASYAIKLLESAQVDYCLIKAYDIPMVVMDDVDMLIEDRGQLLRLYRLMMDAGFRFKHVPFNDRLKLSAINKNLGMEIDFYPDSKWGDLRYAKKGSVSSAKRQSSRQGIKCFAPKPEHDIYMMASHAYYHGGINLREVIATAKIISEENPSIDEIIAMSAAFHLQNGTLVLLSAADWLLSSNGYSSIPKDKLEKLHSISNKRFRSIAKTVFSIDSFPIRFSIPDLISASLDKITAPSLDPEAHRFDEFAGFVKHNTLSNTVYTRIFPEYVSSSYIREVPL